MRDIHAGYYHIMARVTGGEYIDKFKDREILHSLATASVLYLLTNAYLERKIHGSVYLSFSE